MFVRQSFLQEINFSKIYFVKFFIRLVGVSTMQQRSMIILKTQCFRWRSYLMAKKIYMNVISALFFKFLIMQMASRDIVWYSRDALVKKAL